MPSIVVHDLSAEAHRRLAEKAQRSGETLETFLKRELEKLSLDRSTEERESVDEVLAGLERRLKGSVGGTQAVQDLEEARADRDRG